MVVGGVVLRIARCVKRKSRAVTGTPSLQRASGRIAYVRVNGGVLVNVTFETSVGRLVKSGARAKAGGRPFADPEELRTRATTVSQRVEAAGLGDRPEDDGAAALRRLLGSARCRSRGEGGDTATATTQRAIAPLPIQTCRFSAIFRLGLRRGRGADGHPHAALAGRDALRLVP